MDFFQLFGLLLFYAGGAGFAWFAAKLSGMKHAPGTTMLAALCGIVSVIGLGLINGSPAYDGGKTSPAFLGLYGFVVVGVISYIKTKRAAKQ